MGMCRRRTIAWGGIAAIAPSHASQSAETSKSATHVVLESYPDWWVRKRRAPPGLVVQGAEDLEELNRHMGFLHSLGVPLTLAERRTPAFRFFQDLEAWGSREAAPAVNQLMSPDSPLTRLIGQLIGEVFPSPSGFLDVAIYNATGFSQTKGVRKMSLRLVWPGLLVDADRSLRVRDLLVSRLVAASAEDAALKELEEQLKAANPVNAYRPQVRMPLCDRVAPLPLRGPERRPFNPVGVMRFTYSSEGKMKVEWLCEEADLDPAEWAKIGCLRKEGEANVEPQLTEWRMPSWQPQTSVPPSATRPGRIKVRTTAGSDGPGCGGGLRMRARHQASFERAGTLQVVERTFACTVDEFIAKMDLQLGKASVEPDGAKVWKQPSSQSLTARVAVTRKTDLRSPLPPTVIGRPNQVRSLVVIIAPHTEAPKKCSLNNLAEPKPRPSPSAAFTPKATAGEGGEKAPEAPSSPTEPAIPEGQLFTAAQEFHAVGQGELGLNIGDVVRLLMDPQVGTGQENVSAVEKMNVLEASSWAVPVDNTVQMDTTFNESTMYSIVEGTLPSAAVDHGLSGYDGLEIAFSNTKENVSAVEKMNVLEASSWAVPVDNTVQMDTTFNESTMYSIVEGTLPSAAVDHGLSGYDGLEIAFSNTKEAQQSIIKVDVASKEEFRIFYDLLGPFSWSSDKISEANVDSLHRISDYYHVEIVKAGCEELLLRLPPTGNRLVQAHKHGLNAQYERCVLDLAKKGTKSDLQD
ncbi:hypothetical protein AK812_SmicGene39403 [Symbiodinium microadriaticum]|uniref:Uncharacterized protein n=1 Tax=Symbiodinium microadriaticum TaxID=2951 RepID=A0A1Q9CBB3_SYMMI|nr:hypothetical protein AK812_SmicGene39403 [Symbiodinium microadriaticum]